jgi:hypothetical protein
MILQNNIIKIKRFKEAKDSKKRGDENAKQKFK